MDDVPDEKIVNVQNNPLQTSMVVVCGKNIDNHSSSNLMESPQESSCEKRECNPFANVWENPLGLQTSIHNEPGKEVEYFPNNLMDSPPECFDCDSFGNIQENPIQSNSDENSKSKEVTIPTHILDRPPPLDNPFDNPLDLSHLPLDNLLDRPLGYSSLLDNSNLRSTPNQTHINFNPMADLFDTSSNHTVDHTMTNLNNTIGDSPNPINTNVNPFYFPDPPPPYHMPPGPMFR